MLDRGFMGLRRCRAGCLRAAAEAADGRRALLCASAASLPQRSARREPAGPHRDVLPLQCAAAPPAAGPLRVRLPEGIPGCLSRLHDSAPGAAPGTLHGRRRCNSLTIAISRFSLIGGCACSSQHSLRQLLRNADSPEYGDRCLV